VVNQSPTESLVTAVQRYFNLMYDCDVSAFNEVFRSTAQLHGFRDGQMKMWPAAEYREVLRTRESPKAQGALREEEMLMLDFASPTQALAKVRVRIGPVVFCDYLTYHRFGDEWLITSKAYHVVQKE
jgi:hypothetical protein